MAERIREKLEKLDKSALVERAASQWARIRSLLTSKGLDPNFFDRYNARVAKLEATIARLQERGHVPADDIPGVEDPAVDLAEQDISEADRVTDPPPPEEAEREELITKLEEQLIQQAAESKQELEQLQALLAEQDEAHESELKSQKQIFSDAVKKMTEALDIRLAENAEQKAELEAELQTAGKLGARLVAENAEQKAELEALRAQVDEAKGDKERAERWFGAESKGQRAQIASLSTELACLYDIGKELEDKDAELKHSKEELKGLCAKLTRLNDDVRRLTSENHDLKETVAEYRGSWSFRGLDARTADSLTAAEGEKARLEAVVADLQDQIARLQADARTQLIPPPVVAIGGSVGSRLTELLTELRGELTQTAQIKERLEADLRESQAQLAALRAGQTAELQVRDVRLEELEKLLIAARQESAEEIARLEKERAAALQSLGAVQTELAGAQSGVYEKAEQIRELEGKLGEIELQVEAVRRDSEVEVETLKAKQTKELELVCARLIGLESTLATQGAELAVAKADADKKASEALKLEGAFVAQTSGNAELETRLAKAQAEIVKKAAEHEKELEEQKFTREVLEGELAESQAGVKKQTGEIARLGDQLAKSILQVDALTTLQSELTEEQGKLQAGLLIAVARISALSQANAELEEQSIRKIQERDSQLTTAHAALSERDIKIESLAGELATITAVSQAQAEGFAAKDRSSQDLIQEQDDSIAGLQARLAAQRAEFDELLGDSERTHSEQISTLSSRASGSIDALQSERNRLELQLKEQGEALTKQLHEVKKSYEDQLGLLRADLASQDQRARESIAARDRTLALATEELAVARARAEQLEGAIGKLRADFAAEHHGLRNALDEADRQLALQSAGFQGAVQAHAAEIEKLHAGLAAAESGAVSERVAHAAALALAEVNAAADAARAGSALAALRAELAAAQQSNAASTSEVAALRAAAEAAGKQSAEELTRLRAAHAAEIARLKEELAELAERAVSDVAVQTTITPLRDARAVAVQTEALLAAGVAPAFPPAAPVLRSDDDAAGPAVLTAAEPVQEAPAGHTADGDWVKCETYDSTKSEFFIKDARAEVRSISHTSHKQELALEVFLSMYIAGCRQGMTPTVFASGSDPELVALFYVYAEFFKAAGMPIEVTGTPSGEAQGLAAAKVRIKQYICGDTAATLSDKEVGRKIVDLFLSSKSSASGDLDAFLGRMGFSNESAIRAKRAEISTDKSIYWAARKSDTEQLKKFEAFGAGLKVLSDALDRQVGSDSDPVKAITESLKQTVDAPRVVPGRS